ncbi:MAG: nitrilase-related carbon-nitrogen hydrolase [Clostridiales bacterium]
MRGAIIQFAVKKQDKSYNFNRAEALLRQAAAQGAEMAVLPELWSSGFDVENADVVGESSRGETVSFLRNMAAELNIFIGGASFIENRQDKYYNTSVAIDRQGNLLAKYRKAHLFSYEMNEGQYLQAGEEWVMYQYPTATPLTVGMLICYDLRFPEFARNMALRGTRIFTVPACWPKARISEYELFCRARAAENRCFLLSANYCGGEASDFCGNSLIVSPFGEVLARGNNHEQVLVAEMDLQLFANPHLFNSVNDRRQLLDEIDDSQL